MSSTHAGHLALGVIESSCRECRPRPHGQREVTVEIPVTATFTIDDNGRVSVTSVRVAIQENQ